MKIDFKKNQNYINRKNCSLCHKTNLKMFLILTKLLSQIPIKKNSKRNFAPLKCVICEKL